MDLSVIIAFTAAVLAFGMAIGIAASSKTITHWCFVAGMLLTGAESLFVGFTLNTLIPQEAVAWQQWRLTVLSLIPGAWFMFSLLYARDSAKSKLLLKPTHLAALLVPFGFALLFRNDLVQAIAEPNAGNSWTIIIGPAGLLLNLWVLMGVVLVLTNLERTYRSAVGTMRWRIKFMVLGLGVLSAVHAFTSSQAVLFRSLTVPLETLNSAALILGCALICRTLLRTGHFEVGVYVSRSVLQGSLTLICAGVYLVILGVIAKLTTNVSGTTAFQLRAFGLLLALILGVLVLFSDRVRLHFRNFVSRHFQKPIYDYRQVWKTCIQRTANCVDETALSKSIAGLVSEVFNALSVNVWLCDEQKHTFNLSASTSVSTTKAEGNGREAAGLNNPELITFLASHQDPFDLDVCKDDALTPLKECQRGEFPNGGHRVCVAIMSGPSVLGFILVADRVAGVRYNIQDFELLKTISDQAAASLLNIRLSSKLAEARQLEGFQAMSAFFVHDLKNTASTLSLMLKNFPIHYQNPEFREDALRGISKTVAHVNDLIQRLNMLRHELQIQERDCDLNQMVRETLQTHTADITRLKLASELGAIPTLRLDPGQIQKVLTNLLLNARDAVGEDGEVRVETARQNGWVVLSVADNGCGMSEQFMRESLFRPFQSTKQKGLGIGMFHCKMIVEAHRGRIEVDSAPGKGTKFRVLLPVQ